MRLTKCLSTTIVTALVGIAALTGGDANASDSSLTVPMFGDRSETLWPVELTFEIIAVETGEVAVPERKLVVADGQHTILSEVVRTPRGQRSFALDVVARHHAGGRIELEYDLLVRDAYFRDLTWRDYLLNRLNLAPRPALGPDAISAARADIVETRKRPHNQRFTVAGDQYEIRLKARSMRG